MNEDFTLNPEEQQLQDFTQQQVAEQEAQLLNEQAPDPEVTATPIEEDKFSDVGDVVRGVAETALQPVLGVGDFASDVVGLVPWLKPVDNWWDENSYRSTHAGHKLLRDASSIILPTMLGGGAVVGSAKLATKAMAIPKYARTLGSIAAYTGVDTGVAMISSHSKKDDNMAATLNNWLGWDIPWATRAADSPDVRWKKNVMEAAGFAGGVELLGAAFSFARKAKLIPRDEIADTAIRAREAKTKGYSDPTTAAVEARRESRKAAQTDEAIDAFKRDPNGDEGYNPFINDLGEDSAGRAVNDLEADPLMAKLDQLRIQNNLDTYNGRATPVVDESWQKRFTRAVNTDERAKQLDELFSRIAPNFDAIVDNKAIPADKINLAVDNLTNAIYGKDLNLREFEIIVDDMKNVTFNSNKFLGEEEFAIATKALREAYEQIFDPNQLRASAMLSQQAADTLTDAATAGVMLGDTIDTSRQMSIMFDKLTMLAEEVKANQYITNKAQEYRRIIQSGDELTALQWLQKQADDFDEYLKVSKSKSNEVNTFFKKTAKENPNYYKAFQMLYDKTNGDIDQISKMHAWAEEKIGVIKKGFIDNNPKVPSVIVQGMQTARINSILMGLAPVRAMLGNATLTAIKPLTVFAGAAATLDAGTLRRASYVYGGITENIKRGFKVMGEEWRHAVKHPEEMGMRGRADLRQAKIEDMEILDEIAEGWRANNESGKLAMYNIAKGLTWWNNQSWTKYGTSSLHAIDGMLNSFMASGVARAKAYDNLLSKSNGAIDKNAFRQMQRNLYDQAFDNKGVLTDTAAKEASKEFALNMDNQIVKKFDDFLTHFPVARGLFLFPRTGINALQLSWTFNPASNLGPALSRARKVLGATTREEKLAQLVEHGIDATQDADAAFKTLKSEYIGRQIMGSSVIMGAGLWAMEGNLTGNGPQDAAEKRRMLQMGWVPKSIKNPITGEWHSYEGFEPFDKLLGLTADIVYYSDRVDQAVTEDFFRKASYSISMNITNSTFLSGFNPIASLISGDPSAWNRFTAQQADQLLIPFRGIRSILNNTITPQIKDVENDFWAYLKNANKFLFSGNEHLRDVVDVYTGKPIKYFDPFTAAFNAVLPTFKQNAGNEPWREWLLATGWDGLQKIRRNKITKHSLSTEDRHFINNWIANNAGLRSQIIQLMNYDDGYWQKQLNKYKKARKLKSQDEFPIKEFLLHQRLDEIHDNAYDAAWDALQARNENFTPLGREKTYRNWQLQRGDTSGALETQKRIKTLLRQNK
tara:strand:- start:42 stop:3845 length:3804 start_codon:yes stop_codon:yes gene_type:complete